MTERRSDRLRAFGLGAVLVLSVLVLTFGLVGTASAVENVDSCTHINESGTYQLTGDIQPSDPDDLTDDTCILINSSDVTLDGSSRTVDGSGVAGTFGIQVENTTDGTTKTDPADQLENVTIRNVTFVQWPGPVALRGVNESEVRNLELRETGNGADVFHEHGHTSEITDIRATAGISDIVVTVTEVDDANISDVTAERASGDGRAIDARDSPDVEIKNVTVDDRNNADAGADSGTPAAIFIQDSPGAVVTNNTVMGVDMQGIRLTHISAGPGNPNALVAHNDVVETTDAGIEARRSDNADIRDNDLNGTHGIRVDDSTGVVVRDNTVLDVATGARGVELVESTQTSVVFNRIEGGFTGIQVNEADPQRLNHNHISNTSEAIDIEGSSSVNYDGFQIRNTTISGGDVSLQEYHNVTISNANIEDGRIEVGSHLGDHRNITIANVEITDAHQDASVRVEGAEDIQIENLRAVDGLDHALELRDVSNVTVKGVTVTGQDDSDQNSFVSLVWLVEVDNASISGLNVSDNPVDGEEASSSIDGGVTAVDVRHTSDSIIENVEVRNNIHGTSAAITASGDSTNVTFTDVSMSETDGGAFSVEQTGVLVSGLTIGDGTSTETTLSFEGRSVVVSEVVSPPSNPDAESIGRYFEAESTDDNAFIDFTMQYEEADVTVIDESTLALWMRVSCCWIELNGPTVDTNARTISGNLTGLETFGGFGVGTAEPDPADFSVTITDTNSPVDEGEKLNVTVDVENAGDEQGEQNVTLTADSDERDRQLVDLSTGETETVTLSWDTGSGDAGDYTATAASENDSATESVTVESGSTDSPSDTSSSTGSSSTSSSTASTVRVSALLEGGETSVDLDEDVSGLRVTFSDDAASGSVTVESLDARPDSVTSIPDAAEIAFVDVTVPSSLEDAEASLRLTVSADAIGDATPSNLVVYHYDDAWTALNTTVVSTTGDEIVLEATTPGFSTFAIGSTAQQTTPGDGTPTAEEPASGTPAPTATPTPSPPSTETAAPSSTETSSPTEAPGQPGFGLLVALAAVALFGLSRHGRD